MSLGHQWMVDVLNDLTKYANENELKQLSKELQRTAAIAMNVVSEPKTYEAANPGEVETKVST